MSLTSIVMFLAIVAVTLYITYWASKRTSTASDFYTAGGLKGWQNGLAISGIIYLFASFLGIAGSVALYGYDGFYFSIGYLVAYLVVLYIVAEPLRNLGKFTLADMITARFDMAKVRGAYRIKYNCYRIVLHDCTACWCRCTYSIIIRYSLLGFCINRWRHDDNLCIVRRNDCYILGTNY